MRVKSGVIFCGILVLAMVQAGEAQQFYAVNYPAAS